MRPYSIFTNAPHSSFSILLGLLNNLREPRDGNRRPFESAIRTLGQRRTRRELKGQRSTRSYLPRDRRVGSHTGALFARVKLILPQKCRANEELHIADRILRVIANYSADTPVGLGRYVFDSQNTVRLLLGGNGLRK